MASEPGDFLTPSHDTNDQYPTPSSHVSVLQHPFKRPHIVPVRLPKVDMRMPRSLQDTKHTALPAETVTCTPMSPTMHNPSSPPRVSLPRGSVALSSGFSSPSPQPTPYRAPHITSHRVPQQARQYKGSPLTKTVHNSRPLQSRSANTISSPFHTPRRPILNSMDWREWPELSINFLGFDAKVTTKDVWTIFKQEGDILSIELYDDFSGKKYGRGRVRFSPPPARPFWQSGTYDATVGRSNKHYLLTVKLIEPRREYLQPSLADPDIKYPESIALIGESIDFGILYEPNAMMSMYRAATTSSTAVKFRSDFLRREIEVEFQIVFRDVKDSIPVTTDGTTAERPGRIQDYVFTIPFAQTAILHDVGSEGKSALLLSLDNPPNFYRKYDAEFTHDLEATFWSRRNTLFRQTDITFDPRKLRQEPITLKKARSIIDIGRWNTYLFTFDMEKTDRRLFTMICNGLRDFNIDILPLPNFKLVTDREPAVWQYIDRPISQDTGYGLSGLHELIAADTPLLRFPVRYQLEVCISEGVLNEHNMTKQFVDTLAVTEPTKAQALLEYVAGQKKRIYNPMEIFNLRIVGDSASRLPIPHYCTYVRSATVTPTMVYFNSPSIETSNRVLRQYREHADRFLRVRFSDEKFQGGLNATDGESMNEVFTRVRRALNNGITIGDRHYEYLASGNSQFREHGAYFFCPLIHLGVADIRRWMGDFGDINVVAKYAARLGQCFSTTRAINGTRVDINEIRDIVHDKYVFTDGVGKISKFLAQMAGSEVGAAMPNGEPPSVFQFRLGGAKGVLAVSPDAKMREIHLRPSQYKFHTLHNGLEIIRWSQFSAAHLNRQLISVLSALKVPDRVFVEKLTTQLSNLAQAMVDEKMALILLQREIDPNQMTLALAAMILDGFQKAREPFMLSVLQLWRAWSIKYLKEKAKIVVHKGAVLLGCVDETRTLRGHFNKLLEKSMRCSEQERINSLPEVFVQLSKGENDKPQVMLGPMALARNPSLHPGDIRVVRGVDVPALHHLKDVVVLPQTGDIDIAHMCSGGDLDGDDYLVIWDKDLLPREWNHNPMNYAPPTPIEAKGAITIDDITTFFVNYIKNNTLPKIAHAHLAFADYLEKGVKDDKCLKLAALHSKAVDYPKTGVHALIPADLKPRLWPHFMEKTHKPKSQQYVSKKVLGQLYDLVERVDFAPEYDAPFDERILTAFKVDEKILAEAVNIKMDYDAAMLRILAQHNIATEFEVWSTFVLQHANQSKDYKFHEEMGQISFALKDRFRTICYQKAGGRDFEHIGPFVAAMYRVTYDQVQEGLKKYRRGHSNEPVKTKFMPLISFPWLFASVLGQIATGSLSIASVSAQEHSKEKTPPKKKQVNLAKDAEEDVLATSDGIVHRGELLKLFDHEDTLKAKGENILSSPAPEKQKASSVTPLGLSRGFSSSKLAVKVEVLEDTTNGKTTAETTDSEKSTLFYSDPWAGLEELSRPTPVVSKENNAIIEVPLSSFYKDISSFGATPSSVISLPPKKRKVSLVDLDEDSGDKKTNSSPILGAGGLNGLSVQTSSDLLELETSFKLSNTGGQGSASKTNSSTIPVLQETLLDSDPPNGGGKNGPEVHDTLIDLGNDDEEARDQDLSRLDDDMGSSPSHDLFELAMEHIYTEDAPGPTSSFRPGTPLGSIDTPAMYTPVDSTPMIGSPDDSFQTAPGNSPGGSFVWVESMLVGGDLAPGTGEKVVAEDAGFGDAAKVDRRDDKVEAVDNEEEGETEEIVTLEVNRTTAQLLMDL